MSDRTVRDRAGGRGLAVALAAALLAPRAWGLSARASFTELVLDGLEPGRSYTLVERTGGRFRVTDTGGEPLSVELAAGPPGAGTLKDGFEPGADWVAVENPRRDVEPRGEAGWDLKIRVPATASPGSQHQVALQAVVKGAGRSRLVLTSRLLLRVGRGEPEIGPPEPVPGMTFQVMPRQGNAVGVPLGRRVPLTEPGTSLKLVNVNGRKATFRLSVASGAPEGWEGPYEPSPNPDFLRLDKRLLSAPADSIVAAPMSLEIPDQPRYRGRRWVFTVLADLLEAGEAGRKIYRLYVETEKGKD